MGQLFQKTFNNYTDEQVLALFNHSNDFFEAVLHTNFLHTPKPIRLDRKTIYYEFIDLGEALSEKIKGAEINPLFFEKIGQSLSFIHLFHKEKNLLHSDFVLHNLFMKDHAFYIIDPHPPENIPYSAKLLYGHIQNDISSFIYSFVSNIGIKKIFLHIGLYKKYVSSFLKGYRNRNSAIPGNIYLFLASYTFIVYKIKRKSGFSLFSSIKHCLFGYLAALLLVYGNDKDK